MPLDIQWFIFALVTNGALTRAEAEQLYASLGSPDLTAYAQSVLDRLVAGLSQEDAQSVLEQIQAVIDYAVGQAETGIAPEYETPATPAPAAAPREEEEDDDDSSRRRRKQRTGLVADSATRFEGANIDLSQIHSYADLPTLRDISQLDDAQVAERMILLLTCLRALGCSDLHLSAGAKPFVRRMLNIERIDDYVLPAEDAERLNTVLLSPERKARFYEDMDINFALEVGKDRFRVCLMMHKDGMEGS